MEVFMPSDAEIRDKFWKHLKSDRTVMLSLEGVEEGQSQPMTALVEDQDCERGVMWIFTSKETDLTRELGRGHRALAHFASKGHDVFAAVHGYLVPDNDRAVIDRLWSPFVAAWYEGGKDDPNLLLMRFDAEHAKIWLNENSTFAGIKMLLGRDPKKDAYDKIADVRL
jgi:general stress protein 26